MTSPPLGSEWHWQVRLQRTLWRNRVGCDPMGLGRPGWSDHASFSRRSVTRHASSRDGFGAAPTLVGGSCNAFGDVCAPCWSKVPGCVGFSGQAVDEDGHRWFSSEVFEATDEENQTMAENLSMALAELLR